MANQLTVYQSTDTGAPVITPSTNGSALGVLRACLRDGYGTQVAAGWTTPFQGTNIDVYQAPGGVQHFCQVSDIGTNSGGTTYFLGVFGFETMSAFNTGTGQFPTNAQFGSSSSLKGVTPGPTLWRVFADSRTFYFFIFDTTHSCWSGFMFGEIYALQSNDAYRTLSRTISSGTGTETLDAVSASIATGVTGMYMPRGYAAVGASVNMSATGDSAKSGSNTHLLGLVPLPNPEEGGLYVTPVWVSDPTTAPANNIRGRMRGFWQQLHPIASLTDAQTYSGIGDLAGRTYFALKPSGNAGCYMIETSATLETN